MRDRLCLRRRKPAIRFIGFSGISRDLGSQNPSAANSAFTWDWTGQAHLRIVLLCMESSSQANLRGAVPGERTDVAKKQISAFPCPRISLTAAGRRRRHA